MKKPARQRSPDRGKPQRIRRPGFLAGLIVAGVCGVLVMGAALWWNKRRNEPAAGRVAGPVQQREPVYVPKPSGQLTFSKHIAPIVFQHCANCHRPGQAAPFALLSYQDVKKRTADIADATAKRYMPPWLPEPGYGKFVGARRLSAEQLGMIQQWIAEGAVEGAASDLPPLPKWDGDWQLGTPDLIVTMPEPYALAAEGRDVYRNFVIPSGVAGARHVRGVELRPGNSRVVHHAFVKLDRTAQSRRQDAQDAGPGFGGMNVVAEMPGGHFLGWQPGRVPAFLPEGLAWRLDPGNDLVLQMHLNTTGRPETLQSSVGLYFTEQPPTNNCFKMYLTSFTIDIPAGAREHPVEDSFVLSADVQVLAVLPHAHYLAKEMQGWATRPDGTREWLLWIKQWDFNWQGDYRYARPVFLPKGTTLSMRFTYDNSTNNPANRNQPPRPVAYGPQSTDEMAELWFQLLPAGQREYDLLSRDFEAKRYGMFVASSEHNLRKNPRDAAAHLELGLYRLKENRFEEAERHFRAALEIQPGAASSHYHMGLLFRRLNNVAEARSAFENTLRLEPENAKAHGNLGFVLLLQGEFSLAQRHFQNALRLNPDDAVARDGLEQALRGLGVRR
jgi:hypothetical protein